MKFRKGKKAERRAAAARTRAVEEERHQCCAGGAEAVDVGRQPRQPRQGAPHTMQYTLQCGSVQVTRWDGLELLVPGVPALPTLPSQQQRTALRGGAERTKAEDCGWNLPSAQGYWTVQEPPAHTCTWCTVASVQYIVLCCFSSGWARGAILPGVAAPPPGPTLHCIVRVRSARRRLEASWRRRSTGGLPGRRRRAVPTRNCRRSGQSSRRFSSYW